MDVYGKACPTCSRLMGVNGHAYGQCTVVEDRHDGVTRYRTGNVKIAIRDATGEVLATYATCCPNAARADRALAPFEHSATCEHYTYVSETWLQG